MEIEFLDEPEPDAPEEAVAPPQRRSLIEELGLAGPVLLAAAAVLAAIAPFQRAYRVTLAQAGFRESVVGDGWGRVAVGLSNGTPYTGHGPRFGIVAAILAGLCALIGLAGGWLQLASRWRTHRAVVAAPAAAMAVGLGALTASVWLDATAQFDNAHQQATAQPGETLADVVQVDTSYGPFLWLLLAATACAVAASAVAVLPISRARRPPRDAAAALADEAGEFGPGRAGDGSLMPWQLPSTRQDGW